MIDIESEQLRLLAKASVDVPGHPHVSTLMRWALRGVKGIKLETVVVGGRRFTSREAIQRFVSRLNSPTSVTKKTATIRRQAEIDDVAKQLDVEGI
jgi:hypothetical protein